jgi:hypothetical protein
MHAVYTYTIISFWKATQVAKTEMSDAALLLTDVPIANVMQMTWNKDSFILHVCFIS